MRFKSIFKWFKRKKHTISHHRQACARCGRMVAHTQGGIPFLHKCITSETIKPLTQESETPDERINESAGTTV